VLRERVAKMIPDADAFFSAKQEWKSIRVNTLKIDRDKLLRRLQERYEIKEMPWYENGFFIKGENIAKNMEHYLGYYHIQEAASMLPPLVLQPEKDFIIDACAAPGSKTTQLAMMMNNGGVIVANDVSISRIKALTHNIQKAGATNCIITNYDARYLYKIGIKASKILIDAPCTASGKIIKDKRMAEKWKYWRVKKMSRLQKALIRGAYECLQDDGIIIYSTCSIEPEENEEVIDYALQHFNLEIEKISIHGIKTRHGIKEWNGKKFEWFDKVVRIWPQDNLTEGFFICKLRKC